MIKKLLLSLYVFVLLFSPPIMPEIRSMYILAGLSIFLLLIGYRKQMHNVIRQTNIGIITKLFLVLSAYIALVAIMSGGFLAPYFLDSIGKMLLTGPILAICILFLITVFKSEQLTLNDALRVVMFAGLIQVVLSLLAFLSPEIKMLFVSIMQHNVGTAALFDPFQIETRLFGFAGDMFDRFGYGMGMMAALPALLAYNTGRMRYLMLIPLFLIAIILNSRTGILIAIVAALPLVIAAIKKHAMSTKNIKTTLTGLLIAATAIIGGVTIINGVYSSGNSNIQNYTVSNYESVFEFLATGDSSSTRDNTAGLLFSDKFWELPPDAHSLIFGTSHSKYGVKGISHSDVGYINDIWMFGLIGAFLAYFVLSYFTLSIKKIGIQYRILALGILGAFFLYQMKGVALWSANFGIAFHILIIALIYSYLSSTKKGRE